MRHRIAVTVATTLLAGAVLSGCSGDERPAAKPSGTVLVPGKPGEPNRTEPAAPAKAPAKPTAAEIRFVQMMIPHHEQAQAMSVLAPQQASDRRVKALAKRIDVAQGGEIAAMQSWLRRNNVGTGTGGHGGHGGHGAKPSADPHANMPGMATPQQMEQLRAARGEAFDKLYLELMITHHQGALTMVKDVLDKGQDVVVQELAREVQSGQLAEIERMRGLQKK
ncbi:DUF305 domain-containing protein [Actinomadura kijaniata]|uniref:DUF305 domain-containing protein n=1 Tax=Actinomadura kijaniata TaxID=46161 RepID=UPI00082C86FE|nr:DUF305 domain-containing protein [Actinomadura kijaniata]